jgi:transcriptional regulator of acetoin/glycerol metabolism
MSADTLCPLKQARQSPYPQDVIGRQQLLDALISTQGNKAEAARMLGISRVSLYKRLGKYDIKTNKSVSGTD